MCHLLIISILNHHSSNSSNTCNSPFLFQNKMPYIHSLWSLLNHSSSISHSHSSSASPSLASFPFSYKGTQVSHKLKKHSSWQRNPSPITPLLYFPKTQLLKALSLLPLLFKYLLSTNVSSTQGHSSKQNRLFLNPPSYGLHPAPTSTHHAAEIVPSNITI